MTTEQEATGEMEYRVFCAYPKRCGAEIFTDSEVEAQTFVDFHEEAHNGKHSCDYESI